MNHWQQRTILANNNKATLQEMYRFTTMWNCVCGICPVCKACLKVIELLTEEEE